MTLNQLMGYNLVTDDKQQLQLAITNLGRAKENISSIRTFNRKQLGLIHSGSNA